MKTRTFGYEWLNETFCKNMLIIFSRMGWTYETDGAVYLITMPEEDEELFDTLNMF